MTDLADNLEEWVDLSTDEFSTIGEYMMNQDGSLDQPLGDISDDDGDDGDDGEGQVIQIDVSNSGLLVEDSFHSNEEIKLLEGKLKTMMIETEELKKALLEQKQMMIQKEQEWFYSQKNRLEKETEFATKQAQEITEKVEKELNQLKAETTLSSESHLIELKNWKQKANTAEKLHAALKHELLSSQESQKIEIHLAIEEALNHERQIQVEEKHGQEKLIEELMSEITSLRLGLNKSQLKQSHLKRATSHGEGRLKRELKQCQLALKTSENSYEELLKTLAEAKGEISTTSSTTNPTFQDEKNRLLSYEDRAVLGQACKEANRALSLVDHENIETNSHITSVASHHGGGGGVLPGDLSQSVVDIIGDPVSSDATPAAAAIAVRKLSIALSNAHNGKIAIEKFNVGEVAMFFPIPKKGESQDYVAFSTKRNKEKHFLADASKQLIGKSRHFKEAYVLGRVVHKELLVADESCAHLCLKPGVNYYVVTVSALPFD